MSGNKVQFILYRAFRKCPIAGIYFLYCLDINQLRKLIQRYQHCQIILVFKAEHIQDLYDIIIEGCIREIFILGDCTRLDINDKEVTIINTNEQDLMFHVLCAAIRYIHREKIKQKKSKNYGLANVLTMDSIKLLEQIENFV